MDKREAILIIIEKGYSIVMYLLDFKHFYCFVDLVVFFTSSETSLDWSHRLLAGYLQCKVARYFSYEVSLCFEVLCFCFEVSRRKGFEASVMFRGYSDGLVLLLIDLLTTRAEPA